MPSTTLRRAYRLRIHAGGTTTPTDLTVDFSLTGLAEFPDYGRQTIHPARAQTETSPWRFVVTDTSAALTSHLADASTGRMDLLGRLIELQEQRDGGTWTRRCVGRLSDLYLNEDQASYTIQVSDERWKERRAIAFDAADTTQLWPAGMRYPWRSSIFFGDKATGSLEDTSGSFRRIRLRSTWALEPQAVAWIKDDLADAPNSSRTDGAGNFDHLRLEIDGTDYPILTFGELGETTFLDTLENPKTAVGADISAWIYAPALGSPADGVFYRCVLWAPTAEPSEILPLHIGTMGDLYGGSQHTWGYPNPWDLVQAVYDALGVRYDATAFAALPTPPRMAWRLTSKVTDLARWLDDHIYGPLGTVAFVDSEGRVAPRSIRLPTADSFDVSTAFEFNASNLREAPTWSNPGQDVVNVLEISYDFFLPWFSAAGAPQAGLAGETRQGLDQLLIGKRTARYEHDSLTNLGEHPVQFDLSGIPSLAEGAAFAPTAGYDSVLQVAAAIAKETFDRWGDGPQRGTLRSLRQVADASARTPEDDVEAGDLVLVNVDTFPDANTNARGGTRVVQIISKHQVPEGIDFDFVDVGPNLQPLTAPTVSVAQNAANPRHAIDVTIASVPSGATAILEVDVGGDTYARKFESVSNGTITVARLPSGTTVKARARSAAPGRTRSSCSTVASVATSALTAPTVGSATVDGRSISLTWSGGTSGYRVSPVYRTPQGSGAWTADLEVPLPAGSIFYTFQPLAASTGYDVGVKLVDEFGGESSVASTTATTAAAGSTLSAPRRPQILQGRTADTDDALPPPELIVGYGLQVQIQPTAVHAALYAEISQDSGFSAIEDTVQPAPGTGVFYFLTAQLDDVERYVRVKHTREGFTDSDWSDIVSAKPTALLLGPVADSFASGYADLDILPDGTVELTVDHGGDADTDRAFFEWVKNPATEASYPTVDSSDSYKTRAQLPYVGTIDDGGSALTAVAGDLILLTVRFWNAVKGFGQTTRAKLRVREGDLVDCQPILDEDDGEWKLQPRRTGATKSIRWAKTTDGSEPALADVQAGTLSTAAEIDVHTSTVDGERLKVGVLPYSDAAGTENEGSLRIVRGTYRAGNDNPIVTWRPAVPAGTDPAGKEAVELVVTDDGDQVALYYRTYDEGASPPAYTREPASGYSTDPLSKTVEVTRPAEGGTPVLIQAYGIDADGHESKPLILRVDGDVIPSGVFSGSYDKTAALGEVLASSTDPDTGSWRLKVRLASAADDTFEDPDFTGTNEFADSTFGVVTQLTGLSPTSAQWLNVAGYFFRTTEPAAATQQASVRSPIQRFRIKRDAAAGGESGNYVRILRAYWYKISSFTLGIKLDLEVGDETYDVGIQHEAPDGSGLIPVPVPGQIEVIAGTGVRYATVTVKVSTGGAAEAWSQDDAATNVSVLVVPRTATGTMGTGKAVSFPVVEEEPIGYARQKNQSGATVLFKSEISPKSSGGLEMDPTTGDWYVKASDFISSGTAAPTGTPDDGEIYIRTVT